MKELLQQYIANGLADFEGLEISGTIPIKQELLNSLIADVLRPKPVEADAPSSASAGDVPDVVEAAPPPPPAAPKKSSGIGGKAVTELVKSMVRRADVEARDGKLILNFVLRR